MPEQTDITRRGSNRNAAIGHDRVCNISAAGVAAVDIAIAYLVIRIGAWVPDLESLRRAIPLANVIEPQSVIERELSIRLEGILSINRPLMKLEVVGGERTHLLVVVCAAKKEVGNHISRTILSPP